MIEPLLLYFSKVLDQNSDQEIKEAVDLTKILIEEIIGAFHS